MDVHFINPFKKAVGHYFINPPKSGGAFAPTQNARWTLNESENKYFQRDLHEVKEHASGVQNILYFKS